MGKMCLYIAMDDYLAQWFVHQMGGAEPVSLPRGSIERKYVDMYIGVPPEGVRPSMPGKGRVAVEIPLSKNRNWAAYTYLSDDHCRILVNIIRDRFDLDLWGALHSFGRICSRQDYLIEAWMRSRGIEYNDTNSATIAKRYQRLRNYYMTLDRSRRQYERRKK